ncbi:MAG: hypothetical protein HGA45_08160, partial [Chloroflexales bacterium]|nr:hypothetical protein [Chloroflexales bacterium]
SAREIWREERALPQGSRLNILGYLGTDDGAPIIGRHATDPARRFIISHHDERTLSARMRRYAYGLYLAAVLAAAGAAGAFVAAFTR